MTKYRRALRPNAQTFDEITVKIVPRFKVSGSSGDEWRIAANVEFRQKGQVLHEVALPSMEVAMAFLPYLYHDAPCHVAEVSYAGGTDEEGFPLCDQEGCSGRAVIAYKMRKDVCCRCGEAKEIDHKWLNEEQPVLRMFCKRHAVRGDCGLDDADRNYVPVREFSTLSTAEWDEILAKRERYL